MSSPGPHPGELIDECVRISQLAGQAILAVYSQAADGALDVTRKQDNSPLTAADLASHNLIREALAKLTPGIPLLSEESANIEFAFRSGWSEYWLVDPLDGTKEFIKRNGEFTVNIALVRDHQPVLGVVHVPVRGVTYWGTHDGGAVRLNTDGTRTPIRVRQPCADPVVVVGSRSHANPELAEHLAQLGPYELTNMGSSLKFCLVAEGKADFYPRLGPTSEWDTAAAHAVVTSAGGKVVTLDGGDLRYNTKDSLLNPDFLVYGDPARDWVALFSDR